LCVRPSDMSITSKCPFDKAHVRLIGVNFILTFDKVKTKLLCPRWLPHGCNFGWLDASFHYIQGQKGAQVSGGT
jgi:hypothetical protein